MGYSPRATQSRGHRLDLTSQTLRRYLPGPPYGHATRPAPRCPGYLGVSPKPKVGGEATCGLSTRCRPIRRPQATTFITRATLPILSVSRRDRRPPCINVNNTPTRTRPNTTPIGLSPLFRPIWDFPLSSFLPLLCLPSFGLCLSTLFPTDHRRKTNTFVDGARLGCPTSNSSNLSPPPLRYQLPIVANEPDSRAACRSD